MQEFKWLLSPEGRQALAAVFPYDEKSALARATSLREAGFSSGQVSALLTQARLRTKAEAKFGPLARELFFTPAGYEQSTRWSLAQAHAKIFSACGASSITDLGCGIGADSLAFSREGLRVTAVESDPETAAFAAANVPLAEVLNADGRDLDLPPTDAIWLDPARRTPAGKRIHDPEQWSPTFSQALHLAEKYRYAGIKVAPGIAYDILPAASQVVWSSENGELLEAVVWKGMGKSGRFASVDGVLYDAEVPSPNLPAHYVEPGDLHSLVLEPDAALIRAGAIASLSRAHGITPISQGIAYLSGDEPVPGCSAFEILQVCANNPKEIKKALAIQGIGPLEIKKRGTNTEPEVLRKKLGKREGKPGVLILSPVMGKHRAIIARRL